MTEKELHKLRRQELLQLLLLQVKEAEELRQKQQETEGLLTNLEQDFERLKARLNSKDAQLHKLKGRLDKKDTQIRDLRAELEKQKISRRIELEEAGSIAEAALRLSGVFEAAQKAADLYLHNIRMKDQKEGEDSRESQQ